MHAKHKHEDSKKARLCADGRKQRLTMRKGESASPTVCTDSVFISATVEAAKRRRTAVFDLPGAYMSADMNDEEEVLMVLRGDLANMMALAAPEVYRKYVAVPPDGKPVLYVKLCKALYSCVKSALLFCRKLWKDLHERGFTINPCDPCVCNKDICGKQMMITWHVDDLKISHDSDDAISGVITWLESIYGQLDASQGTKHEGKVKMSMEQFTRKVIEEFPDPLATAAESPAGENLFTLRWHSCSSWSCVHAGLPHRCCISDNSCI